MERIKQHLSDYELGVFFFIFVMLQFCNLFNAKYFRTGRSLIQDVISLFARYSVGFFVNCVDRTGRSGIDCCLCWCHV